MASGVTFVIMRKILSFLLLLIVSVGMQAQKDVTKFLGIPVDGSKQGMIQKLKAKGFRTKAYANDVLTGVFNGVRVNVYIATNGGKVCRIMLCDENEVDESSIKIRFNKLCSQFEKNPKYLSFSDNQISDDEDISYGITVDKKRYKAVYYQKPVELSDSTLLLDKLQSVLLEKYTSEELADPTEEVQKEVMKLSSDYIMELCLKKSVWFMISDHYGKYYITMYYDNGYNRADGEDL